MVRIDSPGGSVLASERIREAIARFKAKGLPVVVSMGSLAASGGYWVSTPATQVFAEPATITGSIGVFAIIPSFEDTLAQYGVTTDGVRTTPLSGQPDLLGGLTPEVEAVSQAEVERIYRHFLSIVATARHKTPQQVDAIAQGRIWDGGTARQLGLVDRFGGLDDALGWAAGQVKAQAWHPVFLGAQDDTVQSLLEQAIGTETEDARARDFTGMVALRQQALGARLAADLGRLLGGGGAQAYCLECAGAPGAPAHVSGRVSGSAAKPEGWLALLGALAR